MRELLVQAPVIFPVAVSIDERGRPRGRRRVVVFGPGCGRDFVPAHYGPDTTHAGDAGARGSWWRW